MDISRSNQIWGHCDGVLFEGKVNGFAKVATDTRKWKTAEAFLIFIYLLYLNNCSEYITSVSKLYLQPVVHILFLFSLLPPPSLPHFLPPSLSFSFTLDWQHISQQLRRWMSPQALVPNIYIKQIAPIGLLFQHLPATALASCQVSSPVLVKAHY